MRVAVSNTLDKLSIILILRRFKVMCARKYCERINSFYFAIIVFHRVEKSLLRSDIAIVWNVISNWIKGFKFNRV